jgi:hypothetical protein
MPLLRLVAQIGSMEEVAVRAILDAILVGNGRRCVLDLVPIEEDESPFVGLLQVEAE